MLLKNIEKLNIELKKTKINWLKSSEQFHAFLHQNDENKNLLKKELDVLKLNMEQK